MFISDGVDADAARVRESPARRWSESDRFFSRTD
jgi:hypothetical protein